MYYDCHHPMTLFLSTRSQSIGGHPSRMSILYGSHTQDFGKYGRNHGSGVHFHRYPVEGREDIPTTVVMMMAVPEGIIQLEPSAT
ncbi:hypothetical protein PILCRDRAFT_825524, partial [Piloderma croceum F 1598]